MIVNKYKEMTNFHTTLINFIYQFPLEKKELMALYIMCRLLTKTNKEFNNEGLFLNEKLNNFVIKYEVVNQNINEVSFVNFSLLIPNQGVVLEFNLESALKLFLDSIYKHNLSDKELFEREKNNYIEFLLNNYKNIEFIAEKNLLDLLDDNGIFNKIKYKDINNIKDLTLDDVIGVYNKYILNILPTIIVTGKTDIDLIDNTITNYIKSYKLKKKKLITNYNYFYNNFERISKVDYSKFYQSVVYLGYTIKDYSEDDFYKLYLINLLLNSPTSDLLLDNLRKQHGLVYTCGSSVLLKNGLLLIKALTNKDNVKLTKAIIDNLVHSFNNISEYSDLIDKIIYNLSINIKREYDSFYVNSTDVVNKYFKTDITSNEVLKIIKSISIKDLEEFVDRLTLVVDYTLEGV